MKINIGQYRKVQAVNSKCEKIFLVTLLDLMLEPCKVLNHALFRKRTGLNAYLPAACHAMPMTSNVITGLEGTSCASVKFKPKQEHYFSFTSLLV